MLLKNWSLDLSSKEFDSSNEISVLTLTLKNIFLYWRFEEFEQLVFSQISVNRFHLMKTTTEKAK